LIGDSPLNKATLVALLMKFLPVALIKIGKSLNNYLLMIKFGAIVIQPFLLAY